MRPILSNSDILSNFTKDKTALVEIFQKWNTKGPVRRLFQIPYEIKTPKASKILLNIKHQNSPRFLQIR